MSVTFCFVTRPECLQVGSGLIFYEQKTKGMGEITEIHEFVPRTAEEEEERKRAKKRDGSRRYSSSAPREDQSVKLIKLDGRSRDDQLQQQDQAGMSSVSTTPPSEPEEDSPKRRQIERSC